MNNIVGYLYIYGTPTVILAIGFCIGFYLARRGKKQFKASMAAAGLAIVVSSLVISVLIIWSVIGIHRQGSFAGFLLFFIPHFAWIGVLGVAPICISIAFIYLWIKRRSFRAAGYTQLPNLFVIFLALGILSAASAFAWEKDLGARWHMWPYTSLHSTDNPLTLHGWNSRKKQSDAIISINRENAPDWRVSFQLSSMNSKGNISVRLNPTLNASDDDIYHLIPFEPSSYIMTNDGKLERIE